MDLYQSSTNPIDDVKSTYDDKIDDHLVANTENFIFQERKFSLLSTISERDSEPEVNVNEGVALEPEESLDECFDPLSAPEVSKEEFELPTTPTEKFTNPINVKSEHGNKDETLEMVADTTVERKEASPKRDFHIVEQEINEVQREDVVLSKHEVEEIALIAEEMTRQLSNVSEATEVESGKQGYAGDIVKEFEDKFKGSPKSESENPKHFAQEWHGNTKNEQQIKGIPKGIPKGAVSTGDVNHNPTNDHQDEEISETSQSVEDEKNNYEKTHVMEPSPVGIPQIFIHRSEGETVEYNISHCETKTQKGTEANGQNTTPSATPEVRAGNEDKRQAAPESEEKEGGSPLHELMDGFYYLSPFCCCDIL